MTELEKQHKAIIQTHFEAIARVITRNGVLVGSAKIGQKEFTSFMLGSEDWAIVRDHDEIVKIERF